MGKWLVMGTDCKFKDACDVQKVGDYGWMLYLHGYSSPLEQMGLVQSMKFLPPGLLNLPKGRNGSSGAFLLGNSGRDNLRDLKYFGKDSARELGYDVVYEKSANMCVGEKRKRADDAEKRASETGSSGEASEEEGEDEGMEGVEPSHDSL